MYANTREKYLIIGSEFLNDIKRNNNSGLGCRKKTGQKMIHRNG
jgi:hypothetical protein